MKGYDSATGLGFIQNGEYVEVTLPYARVGGEGVQVGAGLFGICVVSGASGDVVNIHRSGVYGLTALTGAGSDATQGALAYWDNTNKRITPVVTGNLKVGEFLVAKTTAQSTAIVLLD